MTTIANPQVVQSLVDRLGRVNLDTPRQWGTMTPHEMLCHLSDSFLVALGERQASSAETWMNRTIIKWVALHTAMPWPKGVPTRPEVNPHKLGTKPEVFQKDRSRAVELLTRFVSATKFGRHPGFGSLTYDEWRIWAFRHVDHHLRQFGV